MKNNTKRGDEEMLENKETISNGAPDSKYQKDQQIAKSDDAHIDSGSSSFVPKRQKNEGSTLKQEVAAEVVKDAQYGGSVSGDGASFGGMRSRGGSDGILGAANATPVAGKARGESRISKKLDRNSTKLNFIPNDTVLVDWDESKPLAEAKDKDQGFNGTYRNEYARSQKNKEAVPGALMFDRSVDMITKDTLYFGEGQVVRQGGAIALDDEVTKSAEKGVLGIYDNPANNNYTAGHPDNYLTRNVEMILSTEGKPVYLTFNEDALTVDPDYVNADVANKSSAANHILMNDAELVRESMDTKAGDEKADIWSPIPRAVAQPTQTVGFLRDIEADTGNEILTAYRKASTSMSYQINRAHKDGQDAVRPGVEALTDLLYGAVSSAEYNSATALNNVFTRNNYLLGAAATMIPLYDSVAKYNTKADIILQPRGLRMHLQTADNNMDPFRANKLFVQAYDATEVFSTIDHDFDPMQPVCLTDKTAVIHRLSWAKLGSYVRDKVTYSLKHIGSPSASTGHDTVLIPEILMTDLKSRSGYKVYIVYPKEASGSLGFSGYSVTPSSTYEFSNGLTFTMYICKDAPSYDSSTEALLTITPTNVTASKPLVYNGYASSSHAYPIISASVSSDANKLYLHDGGPFNYIYSDLRNSYVTTVAHPLLEGFSDYLEDSIGSKYFSLVAKESGVAQLLTPIFIPTIHSTQYFSLWSFMVCAATPWIIKSRINSMRDVLYYEKNVEYPFNSTLVPIKDVLTKAYSNFTYKDYDTELSSGIMKPAAALSWRLPELYQQVGYISADSEARVLMPWYTSQNEIRYKEGSYQWEDDESAMSFPSIRSGVRFAALDSLYGMDEKDVRLSVDMVSSFKSLEPTLANSLTYKYSAVGDGQMILSVDPSIMTAGTILRLPRQLGYVLTAPYGVLTQPYSGSRGLNHSVLGTSSFVCKYWFGDNPTTTADQGTEAILGSVAINVNRAQNFKQNWYAVLASGTLPPIDHGFTLSMNQLFTQKGALLGGRSSFHPYAALTDEVNGPVTTNAIKMMSIQKALWTRIQKLPFILSPFDGLTIDNTDSPNTVVLFDPYDMLYAFGLGGFRASDYRESVYNREKRIVNQGILFVSDPWVEDSPIFREGATSSGISVTKGFEL